MTTKTEAISALKLQHPTLRTGNDEDGYINLSSVNYDAQISQWADNQIAAELVTTTRLAEEAAFQKDRADGLARLEALGLTEGQAIAIAGM